MEIIPINSTAQHLGEGKFLYDEFHPCKLQNPVTFGNVTACFIYLFIILMSLVDENRLGNLTVKMAVNNTNFQGSLTCILLYR